METPRSLSSIALLASVAALAFAATPPWGTDQPIVVRQSPSIRDRIVVTQQKDHPLFDEERREQAYASPYKVPPGRRFVVTGFGTDAGPARVALHAAAPQRRTYHLVMSGTIDDEETSTSILPAPEGLFFEQNTHLTIEASNGHGLLLGYLAVD